MKTREEYEKIWELKDERRQLRNWLNQPIAVCDWNDSIEERVEYANTRIKEINKLLKEVM